MRQEPIRPALSQNLICNNLWQQRNGRRIQSASSTVAGGAAGAAGAARTGANGQEMAPYAFIASKRALVGCA